MEKILKRSMLEHAAALSKKEYSATELTRAYLDSIEARDGEIGAFLCLNTERALALAEEADKRRALGKALGQFDGIPIAIKDNICTLDMPTTCASKMLEDYTPPYNAFAVEKLLAAGFIPLGKTNLDEFGMGSTGENSAFKITKNPHNTSFSAGGSSSGSAAAVAALEAPCALGSDTGGSSRLPSAFCGTIAMKPTYGRVSRYGLVAFASSLEQIAPITRTVGDNSSLLEVISGKDMQDSTTHASPKSDRRPLESLRGLRIAIPTELCGDEISEEAKKAVQSAANKLRELGAEVFEISLSSLKHALYAYYIISSAEASSNLARFDSVRYGHRSATATSQEEIYKLSRSEFLGAEVKRRIMLGSFLLSRGYCEEFYKKALAVKSAVKRDFADAFEKCDAILSPTAPTTAKKLGEERASVTEIYAEDLCCVPANIAGIPALSLPFGKDENSLPIGIQLMGTANSEALLYDIAAHLEAEAEVVI
ncbi:MAG: Asp-tRNA(Asn)/Glu-tRNA(Gln) amidotransferase subunit GatA [Clostridia bacterium]|nr:Asp-tRNA(Asn)/Glu-tRNA(Gln) amidotransferase subunit GatA [Clostridia bacterium]